MFHHVPDNESQIITKTLSSKARRRRRKKKAAAKQKRYRQTENADKDTETNNHNFFSTMSIWAENYAVAATWQLKHQIAYWKAKAQALEFENKILHRIIRQSHFDDDAKAVQSDHSAHFETEDEEDGAGEDDENGEHYQEDHDFEVSEEFIQFLAANAKYKEDAKREKERLQAEVEEEITLQQKPKESEEDRQAKFKVLYGNNWQRIAALEIALQSQFIYDCDKDNPLYWPNIPLNI